MAWNNLKGLEARYLVSIAISIPIVLFAITYFIELGSFSSDFDVLGKLIIAVTLVLFGVYGAIIFLSGLRFKQIGLTLKNAISGIIFGVILYLIFHGILFLLASEKIQYDDPSTITLTSPTFPINTIGLGIFLSVVWEEFVYRAFLLPQFQILFQICEYHLNFVPIHIPYFIHLMTQQIFL